LSARLNLARSIDIHCCSIDRDRPVGNPPSSYARKVVVVAHDMMDAAFIPVIEKRRPQEKQWQDWTDHQTLALIRTLPTVALPIPGRFDLGEITLACTLAYLDYRLGNLSWRTRRGDLATWLDNVSARPSMIASKT
jgi:glutathione S-transferase